MSNAGYHTAITGAHHVVNNPLNCGYVQHLPRVEEEAKLDSLIASDLNSLSYLSTLKETTRSMTKRLQLDLGTTKAAAEFLRNPPVEPFFLTVGFIVTHRGWTLPTGAAALPSVHKLTSKYGRYCLPPPPIPDMPRTRQDMAGFKAIAHLLDAYVGIVLEALDHSELAERTLVILTTDHGIDFPRMKCNLTDHGIGVMLMMRGPNGFSGGKVYDAMVSHIDLYPTIYELAEIKSPKWLQGSSMLPLINGNAEEIHNEIFAEVNYHSSYESMRAIRTYRWKYIQRFHDYPKTMLVNCGQNPSKDVFVEHGWGEKQCDREELYDLIFDPNEACSLVKIPAFREVLVEMRQRLCHWMQRTNDPLLDGPIPSPEGALVTAPDDIRPRRNASAS